MLIAVPNRKPDCRPVELGEGWSGLAFGTPSSYDLRTRQILNLVMIGRDVLRRVRLSLHVP